MTGVFSSELPKKVHGKMSIMDISGRTLQQQDLRHAGVYQISLSDPKPGLYLVRLQNNTNTITQKLIVY
jgi:hypothetical protein